MAATIKDVAKLCGLSVSTVSNVINNKNNVKEKNYVRVMQAIEELGYSPSMLARNLKQNKPNTIGIVVSAMDSTTSQIVEGILQIMAANNYTCIIRTTQHNRFIEQRVLSEMRLSGIAGLLLQTCDCNNTLNFASYEEAGIPLLLFDNYVEQLDMAAIIFNNRQITSRALRSILNEFKAAGTPLDDREIAVITGSSRYKNDLDCLLGVQAVAGADVPHFSVSVLAEHAYGDVMNLFGSLKTMPRLFVTPRCEIAYALHRMMDSLGQNVPVLCLAPDHTEGNAASFIPIPRKAMQLGELAAHKLLKFISSPMFFEKALTVLPSNEIYPEAMPVFSAANRHLKLAMYDGPTTSALLPAIRIFQERFDIRMDVELLPYEKLYELIKSCGKNRNGEYDLFMIDLPWFDVLQNDTYLHNFEDLLSQNPDSFLQNFSPDIANLYMRNEYGIYTLPLLANMQHLFYRRDLFEHPDIRHQFYRNNGVELAPPKTWHEFIMIAQFFTRSVTPSSPVPYGTTLQGMQPINFAEEFFPRQWAYNGSLLSSSGHLALNRPNNARALNSLKETYECTPKELISLDWRDEFKRMSQNELAMYFTYGTHIDMSMLQNGQVDPSSIAIAGSFTSPSLLGGWNLAINQYSASKQNAFACMKWLTGRPMAISNTLMGCSIPHQSVMESEMCIRYQPWLRNFQNSLQKARKRETLCYKNGQPVDTILVDRILQKGILRVLQDEASAGEALHVMEKDIDLLIRQV